MKASRERGLFGASNTTFSEVEVLVGSGVAPPSPALPRAHTAQSLFQIVTLFEKILSAGEGALLARKKQSSPASKG